MHFPVVFICINLWALFAFPVFIRVGRAGMSTIEMCIRKALVAPLTIEGNIIRTRIGMDDEDVFFQIALALVDDMAGPAWPGLVLVSGQAVKFKQVCVVKDVVTSEAFCQVGAVLPS